MRAHVRTVCVCVMILGVSGGAPSSAQILQPPPDCTVTADARILADPDFATGWGTGRIFCSNNIFPGGVAVGGSLNPRGAGASDMDVAVDSRSAQIDLGPVSVPRTTNPFGDDCFIVTVHGAAGGVHAPFVPDKTDMACT